MESLYSPFDRSLALGQHNEDVIEHEFAYHQVPVTRTKGRNDVDFILPGGASLEWKMDVRSQCTGRGIIEDPTLERQADFYGVTFTFARVYPRRLFQDIYRRGRPVKGFGQLAYDGRLCPGMHLEGIRLRDFIESMKSLTPPN